MIIPCRPFDTWYRWFAWRPVLVDIGEKQVAWAWLRFVEKRINAHGCVLNDYRLKQD